jgi:rhodanese-related sulfurtransferase
MTATTTTPTDLPPIVASPELAQALQSGRDLRLIDVRTPAEYTSVHIPGSYNVPLDQLGEHRTELRALDAPIVLVCRSGNRARQAEALLKEVDAAGLHILDGGVSAWERGGFPVNRGRSVWSLERQVRGIAGALVLVGTLGSLLIWQPLIYLSMFVGAGLIFAALTDSCMMGLLLAKLPYNRAAACDVKQVVSQLTGQRASA